MDQNKIWINDFCEISRVVTRGLKRQLELETPHRVCEVVQPQEQPRFQTGGVQPIEAPSNEL
jgi:hypothetical protein